MTVLRRGLWALLALTIQVAALVAQDANPAESQAEISLADYPASMESQPYRVRILVALDSQDFPSVQKELEQALAKSVGSLWDVEIQLLSGLVRPDGAALARWTVPELQERFVADDVEFWFAATVHDDAVRRHVAVRAWQPQFEWLSPVHESTFYESRETAARVVQHCWNLFRPQVLIEHVDQSSVRVRIRAGDLAAADPAFRLLEPGESLVPWMMYYDRDRNLKRRQELPWTYVGLDSRKHALAQGTVKSGLRNPLAGKARARIDKVAVASRPVYPQTRLQIGVQNQPARTLAGYRLELRPKLPERKPEGKKDENDEDQEAEDKITEVFTNRLGEVTLTPNPRHRQIWIFVYSGELLLARVPFVPGSLPFLRLDVPDDSVRLQVEGELQSLQSELINLVAERNTLIAGGGASKKGDWQRVKILRKQIDELPEREKFVAKLAGIRVPAMKAARDRKDRNAQGRIERLCKDVNELIERYLDAEKLKLLKDEIDQLVQDAQAEVK